MPDDARLCGAWSAGNEGLAKRSSNGVERKGMGIEIERKFLVVGEGWRDAIVREQHLVDGLVAMSGRRKVRVCGGARRPSPSRRARHRE